MISINHQIQHTALPISDKSSLWTGFLTLNGVKGKSEFEATAGMLGYFSRLANFGLFAEDFHARAESAMEIKTTFDSSSLSAEIQSNNIHPGTWRILLQMLAHCHAMEAFESIVLAGVNLPPKGMQLQSALAQPYPSQFLQSVTPISILEDSDLVRNFTMQLFFARNLTSKEVSAIDTLVDDWGSIIYTGGFTPIDTVIDAPLLNKPSTHRLGNDVVEIAVSELECDPEASASLINLAICVQNKLPLTSIEIG